MQQSQRRVTLSFSVGDTHINTLGIAQPAHLQLVPTRVDPFNLAGSSSLDDTLTELAFSIPSTRSLSSTQGCLLLLVDALGSYSLLFDHLR